jgi:hypothetical protein
MAILVSEHAWIKVEQFLLLLGYLAALRAANPFCYSHTGTTIHTENNHSTTTFQCVFICSPQLERSCISCQQYLAIDGTFLKCFYVQTLLLSVTVGANGLYLLLEWAFVESKNTNLWEYYVRHLHYCVLQILTSTIMSGLDNEMLSVEDFPGGNVTQLFCLLHLKANFIRHRDQKHVALFQRIANWTTINELR